VREVLYAGDQPGAPIGPGDAARIFTGAPLPEGADAVVREESTESRPVGRDAAQIRGPALAQALVRIGEGAGDIPEGDRVETWLLGE
jgi:molybdopterin molybdotransferase